VQHGVVMSAFTAMRAIAAPLRSRTVPTIPDGGSVGAGDAVRAGVGADVTVGAVGTAANAAVAVGVGICVAVALGAAAIVTVAEGA
jgi:hypothetical protein